MGMRIFTASVLSFQLYFPIYACTLYFWVAPFHLKTVNKIQLSKGHLV